MVHIFQKKSALIFRVCGNAKFGEKNSDKEKRALKNWPHYEGTFYTDAVHLS